MNLNDFELSDEALEAARLKSRSPYITQPARGLALLTRLVAHPPGAASSEQRHALGRLHQLIHHDFMDVASRDNYPAEARAYRDLLALESSLEDLVTFPDLANKTVIGVGGGFSRGKSRFLNTALGMSLLPESTDPTTAIPTYVTGGSQEAIVAVNVFDNPVPIAADALKALSHEFREHYKATLGLEVGFAHILKLLMVREPRIRWKNLAFLDTPGHSKPEGYTDALSDRQIALRQLGDADRIVWLMSAKNGDVLQEDLEFLRELDHRKPLFLVVTKADQIPEGTLRQIMALSRETLTRAGFELDGAMAWSAPLNEPGDRVMGDDFNAWLTRLDGEPKRTNKRLSCAKVFDAYIAHNQNMMNSNRMELATLNELLPLAHGLTPERRKAMVTVMDALRHEQRRVSGLIDEFIVLRQRALDIVGALTGSVALDDEAAPKAALSLRLPCSEIRVPLTLGQTFHTAVVQVRSELKRVYLEVEGKEEPIPVRFSEIREGLSIEPTRLAIGTLLSTTVHAIDDMMVTLLLARA